MSKQYESAYETICAQKYLKQCVVALNNNLQQAKKIFVRGSFDNVRNVRSLYSSLFAFGLITQLIVFWKFFALPIMRLLMFAIVHFFELCAPALRVSFCFLVASFPLVFLRLSLTNIMARLALFQRSCGKMNL
jgi:hypothetical protein